MQMDRRDPYYVSEEEPMEESENESEEAMEDDPLLAFEDPVWDHESDEDSDHYEPDLGPGDIIDATPPAPALPPPPPAAPAPRIRVREMPPPPSFEVYRHPGGPLWMHTPRKRVLPVRPRAFTLTTIPPPAQPPTVRLPPLMHSTFEVGQSSSAPPPTPTQPDGLVLAMMGRVARLEEHLHASTDRQSSMEEEIRRLSAQMRTLERERDRAFVMTQTLRMELADFQAASTRRIEELEREMEEKTDHHEAGSGSE